MMPRRPPPLSEDELFRRRQTDHLWKVKLCGPGGVINGFRGPVRGPGEATDGSDDIRAIPGGGKGLKYEVKTAHSIQKHQVPRVGDTRQTKVGAIERCVLAGE